MNNKGFGIMGLLGFVLLAGIVLCVFCWFVYEFFKPFLYSTSRSVPNYKNVYIVYMKEHNIAYNK